MTNKEFIETLQKITKDVDNYMNENSDKVDNIIEKLKENKKTLEDKADGKD